MAYSSNVWKFYLFRIAGAMELTIAIFVLFLLSNSLSMVQVMILEAVFIVLVMILEIPSGAFADLYGRKLSLSLGMVFGGIGFIIFGIGSDIWTFFAAQVIVAIAWALSSGADSALLYDSLKEEQKEHEFPRLFGRANFAMLFTWAACSLLSGWLASAVGYRPLFFASASFFFISAIIVTTMKEPPMHHREKHYWKHLFGALWFSYDNKKVRRLIIYYGMFAALSHLAWFVIQPYFEAAGRTTMFIGVATSFLFIFAGAGNLAAKWIEERVERKYLYPGILAVASVSLSLLYYSGPWLALALIAAMSFSSGVRDVVVNDGIHKETGSHHRATVSSVQNMSKSLMYAIFAPLIGYAADIFSAGAAFLLMGIGLSLFTLIYIIITWNNGTRQAQGKRCGE